jgi:hypothetical protein
LTKLISRYRISGNYNLQSNYRSAGTKRKNRSRRTLGAALRSSHLARRLTVEIKKKINPTAFGAEPGARTNGHFGFPPAVEPPCPSLSAERYAKEMNIKMKMRFTEKQGQYLAFVYNYSKIHGRAPAEADLERYFKRTPPTIHQMILKLEKKGLITRIPGQPRSIRLMVKAEEVPLLK